MMPQNLVNGDISSLQQRQKGPRIFQMEQWKKVQESPERMFRLGKKEVQKQTWETEWGSRSARRQGTVDGAELMRLQKHIPNLPSGSRQGLLITHTPSALTLLPICMTFRLVLLFEVPHMLLLSSRSRVSHSPGPTLNAQPPQCILYSLLSLPSPKHTSV